MALNKIEYGTGDTLTAEQVNEMQDAIIENQTKLDKMALVSKNYSASSEAEINNAIFETWDSMGNDCIKFISIYISTPNLSLNGGVWFLQISKQTNDYGSIIANCFGDNGVRKMTRTKYVTWQPWEYENPPMANGVEYRTTERWAGKPVYTKLVEYTANSNIGNANSSFGFSVSFSTPNFKNLIRYGGSIEGTGRAIPCFYNPEEGGGYIGVNFMNHQGVAVEMNKITLSSGTKMIIRVWYTKTTD